jgi:hypothetical protein
VKRPEKTKRANPPMSVYKHQRLRVATLAIPALGSRHDDAWHDLAALLDRLRPPRHGLQLHQLAVRNVSSRVIAGTAPASQRSGPQDRLPRRSDFVAVWASCRRGHHDRDADRDGARSHSEAAAGSNDRTSDSASGPARTVRPEMRVAQDRRRAARQQITRRPQR